MQPRGVRRRTDLSGYVSVLRPVRVQDKEMQPQEQPAGLDTRQQGVQGVWTEQSCHFLSNLIPELNR